MVSGSALSILLFVAFAPLVRVSEASAYPEGELGTAGRGDGDIDDVSAFLQLVSGVGAGAAAAMDEGSFGRGRCPEGFHQTIPMFFQDCGNDFGVTSFDLRRMMPEEQAKVEGTRILEIPAGTYELDLNFTSSEATEEEAHLPPYAVEVRNNATGACIVGCPGKEAAVASAFRHSSFGSHGGWGVRLSADYVDEASVVVGLSARSHVATVSYRWNGVSPCDISLGIVGTDVYGICKASPAGRTTV